MGHRFRNDSELFFRRGRKPVHPLFHFPNERLNWLLLIERKIRDFQLVLKIINAFGCREKLIADLIEWPRVQIFDQGFVAEIVPAFIKSQVDDPVRRLSQQSGVLLKESVQNGFMVVGKIWNSQKKRLIAKRCEREVLVGKIPAEVNRSVRFWRNLFPKGSKF